jgi:molecular chaperone GrpE
MSEERTNTTTETQDQENVQAPDTQPAAAQATPAATAEDTPASNGQPDELAQLQARVAQLEKEAAEYKDQWLRAAADYKNFKRRTEQERAELIRSASAGLLLKLLPVVDDMERAIDNVTPEVEASPWYNGFKLIPQKLQTVLESEGVSVIEAIGQEFDPNVHEAVIYEPAGDGQEGKVVGELQKGYKLRDRVLRPTMVKVGQG